MITNAQEDRPFLLETSVRSPLLGSVLCVPLRIRRKIAGAVYVDDRFRSFAFGQREVELLEELAKLVLQVIEVGRVAEGQTPGIQKPVVEFGGSPPLPTTVAVVWVAPG